MTYDFGAQSSYGYGYNAEIGVMSPQPEYNAASPGMNYYPTSTIGVQPYAPVSSTPPVNPMGYTTGYDGYISHPYVYNPPQPTTGAKPMSYYGGGYYGGGSSYYSSGSGTYSDSGVPDYVQVTPSSFTYSPDQNPVAPAIEQGSTTYYVPPTPQNVSPSDLPQFQLTPQDYAQLMQTPNLGPYNQYGQQSPRAGGGGGGPSGGGSGGGQSPQRQQPQQQQRPVNVIINNTPQHPARRSGSGYTGGNTGAVYNPNRQYAGNDYGGAASYGSQYGQGAAGYNAPSIVPYLLLGGLGIGAYMLLKKHH